MAKPSGAEIRPSITVLWREGSGSGSAVGGAEEVKESREGGLEDGVKNGRKAWSKEGVMVEQMLVCRWGEVSEQMRVFRRG